MKKAIIVILCLVLNVFSAEKEIQNKLIIHLSNPVIELPDAKSEYSLDAIEVHDNSFKTILSKLNVNTIKRTIPSFKMENYAKTNTKNKFFQISDLSLIYTLSFKTDISKIKKHKNVLSKSNNVKKVEFVYQYKNTDETVIPDDEMFKYTDDNSNGVYDFGTDTPGRQWGLFDYYVSNSQDRADVSMPEAWDYTTGSTNIKIGFVESTSAANAGDPTNGIEELKGRNSGNYITSLGNNNHSIATAGIAVANTNNDHLVAGVDWNAKYYSAAHSSSSDIFASAIQSCIDENCNIINNSWSIESGEDGSFSTLLAVRNAYFNGSLVVATMGNNDGSEDRVPACYSDIVFSVASTNKNNNYSSFSNHNYYVDVAAPGGTNIGPQYNDICVITGDDGIDYNYGTSFSAPLVSGVASLMMSMREDVRSEDVEYILKHTATDVYPYGFDNHTGYGKINAKEAIRRLSTEYNMERHTTTGGTIIQVDNDWKGFTLYASYYYCIAKKYRIEKTVSFDNNYQGTPLVWGNIDGTLGVHASNPNYQVPWCGLKNGTLTASGATIQTYVYKCKDIYSGETFWYPCDPSEVEFAYTVLGIEAPPLSVSISGPSVIYINNQIDLPVQTASGTYTANPSGGTGTYSYQWHLQKPNWYTWSYQGNTKTITVAQNSDFNLRCTVTSGSKTTTDTKFVTVESESGPDLNKSSDIYNNLAVNDIPIELNLKNNFPNPFNPSTTIRFGLPEDSHISLTIYSITGQKVISLADGSYSKGYHEIKWNGKNITGSSVSNGIYIYELKSGSHSLIKKMVFAK